MPGMPKVTIIIISLYSCIIGVLNLIGGASHNSRFYVVDNVAVRIIGLVFLVAGIGLMLRYTWARYILLLSFAASMVEILFTYDYANYVGSFFLVRIILAVLFFGVPTWVLYRRSLW